MGNGLQAGLTALGKTAEMTSHTAFFKADGLAAFRAGLPEQAVFVFVALYGLLVLHVSLFKHTTNGIRDGQDEPIFLKHGMLPADAFELFHNLLHSDASSQCQRDQPTDGLRFGGG